MGVNQSLPYFLSVFFLFLQPSIQSLEVGALPENTVLGFQYPVVLVGEDKQLGLDALHACGIESTHTLGGIDAVVFLAMDAEDGGVPFIYKAMGGVLVGLTGVGCLVFVPVGIVVFPVAEPVLLGLGVHGLEVEGTVVGDEALEALVVMASEEIDGEAAEGSTYGSHAVFIDKGQIVSRKVGG